MNYCYEDKTKMLFTNCINEKHTSFSTKKFNFKNN